jgi:hypothetical protein
VNIDSNYSRELCCGTHVTFTSQIEDLLIVRVDSKGQSNKRLYCLTGSFAKHARELFENDFQRRFHYLEDHRAKIALDEIYSECRKLRDTYLDDRSLVFPYNQRATYLPRWQQLMPDKKLLRKYLLNQMKENPDQKFIQSHVDLPIYEIGFMLLRYDDETNTRTQQSCVVYVNFHQQLLIIYLKNPRLRDRLIQWTRARSQMRLLESFDQYDDQTRDLFTKTKKLLVLQSTDSDSFNRLNFDDVCNELFATVF